MSSSFASNLVKGYAWHRVQKYDDGGDDESNNYHLFGRREGPRKDENPSWKTSKTSREAAYYYANRLTHHHSLNFELFIEAYDWMDEKS
uniref:Cauli_VI domain-containing protein n=1 Tax=Caenorhabditis tropicalis TaxID=1561998 RepID=A0A1I7TTG3_9PELO